MARRPTILTKQVMAAIPAMIADGMEAAAIAEKLGCNLGTLKVRCSQAGISLRTAKHCRLSIRPDIMMGLREYASVKGCTEVKLAIDLLKVIVQDNLYKAVLDDGILMADSLVGAAQAASTRQYEQVRANILRDLLSPDEQVQLRALESLLDYFGEKCVSYSTLQKCRQYLEMRGETHEEAMAASKLGG